MIRERSWCQETRVEVLWSIIWTSQAATIAFNLLINPKKTLILGHPGKQNLYFLETLYVYSEHFFFIKIEGIFSLTIFFFQATCNFVQIDEGQKYFHYLLGNIHSIILVTVVQYSSKYFKRYTSRYQFTPKNVHKN